jgi:hypothetical protein
MCVCVYIYIYIYVVLCYMGSQGSSVSDYELDNWAIGARSPAEAKVFFI